ncbi:MAG: glycosyltransferase family 9 protein [Terrimicrobiaceae bacterium]|nr:glycosyltransferase family 9 protein [Terrimicrobiaceae bacterium]
MREDRSPPVDPSAILLVKPGSLGDVVHALPVAAALHRAFPRARLAWVIDPRWEPVLAENPAVAERIPFARERYRGVTGTLRAAQWLAGLRDRRPALAIDLQGLLRSALIVRASRAAHSIGLSDAREGATAFYEQTAAVTPRQHAVDRYLSVLPLLGLEIPTRPEFPLGPGEPIERALPNDFILLHPFARGPGKSLADADIIGLCERLAPAPVVLAGIGVAPAALPGNVINLANRTTLAELIGLLRLARAVVSVDSGPMHLAAAIGARLLSIHTWSDPRRVGPYSADAWIWQGGDLRPQHLDAPLLPEQPITPRDLDAIAAWSAS